MHTASSFIFNWNVHKLMQSNIFKLFEGHIILFFEKYHQILKLYKTLAYNLVVCVNDVDVPPYPEIKLV